MGEPAGIGPDLAIACWLRWREAGLPPFYVIADPAVLADRADGETEIHFAQALHAFTAQRVEIAAEITIDEQLRRPAPQQPRAVANLVFLPQGRQGRRLARPGQRVGVVVVVQIVGERLRQHGVADPEAGQAGTISRGA